ncbi:MAG: DNA polymerase III subunit delta', partial [Ramlibacter sp.]|nr:DNA polymerase III subunit delta' [Ramlibacter sp.]
MSTRKPAAPAFVAPPQDGPLPPWLQQQMLDLLQQRGHAWLLQGPSGLGQYAIALGLVR